MLRKLIFKHLFRIQILVIGQILETHLVLLTILITQTIQEVPIIQTIQGIPTIQTTQTTQIIVAIQITQDRHPIV